MLGNSLVLSSSAQLWSRHNQTDDLLVSTGTQFEGLWSGDGVAYDQPSNPCQFLIIKRKHPAHRDTSMSWVMLSTVAFGNSGAVLETAKSSNGS